MNRLTELIVGMLQEHKGGKRFYENLDAEIGRNFDIFNCLYSAVPENAGIIVSGRFGEVFSDYVLTTRKTKNRLLVVTGGIRTGNDIEDLAGYIAEGEGYFFLAGNTEGSQVTRQPGGVPFGGIAKGDTAREEL